MDDDERYVRLSMENDYEGGEWIGGEFFYRSKRQKTQTEDDKIYGVFAGEDSSEDEGRGGRGRNASRQGKANLSKPVAFVSTGKIQTQEPSDSPDGSWVKKEDDVKDCKIGPMKKEEDFSDMEVEEGLSSTALGKRIRDAAAKRQREDQERFEFGKAWKDAEKNNFGTFEKHTKGIGAKLLAKMGYKPGQGLGRDGRGITKPIEQRMRPKGMGMGYGEFREQHMAPVADPQEKNQAGEAASLKKVNHVKEKLWKKSHGGERKKRVYRTPEELLTEEEDKPTVSVQPIIDMRGPQARVVTNLEHLNVEASDEGTGDQVPMPELQHNMKLLVDIAESDIRRIDSKLRHKEDEAVMLGREEKRLSSEVEIRCKEMDRLDALLKELSTTSKMNASMDMDAVKEGYKRIFDNFEAEYTLYDVAAVALGQILAPFQHMFAGWDPLRNPHHGLSEVLSWRNLLLSSAAQREAIFEDVNAPEPFSILICESMLPPIRSVITNQWEPRDPEALIRLIETWENVWPSCVLGHVLDALVYPKLRSLVEIWEPRQERIAVHVWMHPWLPYLGDKMKDLYPTIVFRLSSALQSWHASDGSAFALLSPWHKVFSEQDWENLLLRSIIPKLAFAIQELVINPVAQDLKPMHWVMQWKHVIPLKHMVNLLESQFFPKWLQVLHQWLSNNPNYEEVTQWYLGWKDLIPEHIIEDPRIAAQLGNALSMMNCSVDGASLPSVASYSSVPSNSLPTPDPIPMGCISEGSEKYSLRELVQHFAEENNVEFLPKAGRQHDGLQVYGFGQVNCILENIQNVVRAQIHHQWVSVTLTRLLEEHRARVSKGFQG